MSLPLPASDGGWCVAFSASLPMPPRLIGCVEAVFGRCGLKAQPVFEPGASPYPLYTSLTILNISHLLKKLSSPVLKVVYPGRDWLL